MADTYAWSLPHKPEDSTSSLVKDGAGVSLILDKEGFYIIQLNAYKNNVCIGTGYAYAATPSVVHYIRSRSSGQNTGGDWNNAWTQLPDTLLRGHTYYIAEGSYPPYYCNTEQDRVIPVYIRKAISRDHGTDTGWDNSTMGSGQAVFVNSADNAKTPFMLNSNFVIIDGQVGKGKGNVEQHGFLFSNTLQEVNCPFVIGHNYGVSAEVNNVQLKHSEIISVRSRGFQVHSMASCERMLLHSCYIHDCLGITIYFVNTSRSIVEYCYVKRNHSDADHHAEGIQTGGVSPYNVIRYNTWEDIEGTAIIAGDTGWEIYGNLVFYSSDYINTDPMDRHEAGVECGFVGMGLYTTTGNGSRPGNRIYNNTVVGGYPPNGWKSGTNLAYSLSGDDNLVYNNIWASCARIPKQGEVHDYNLYFNNNRNNPQLEPISELHVQYAESDPFVNSAVYNFNLSEETEPGIELEAKYSYDINGNKRGADGIWSRGAVEYP